MMALEPKAGPIQRQSSVQSRLLERSSTGRTADVADRAPQSPPSSSGGLVGPSTMVNQHASCSPPQASSRTFREVFTSPPTPPLPQYRHRSSSASISSQWDASERRGTRISSLLNPAPSPKSPGPFSTDGAIGFGTSATEPPSPGATTTRPHEPEHGNADQAEDEDWSTDSGSMSGHHAYGDSGYHQSHQAGYPPASAAYISDSVSRIPVHPPDFRRRTSPASSAPMSLATIMTTDGAGRPARLPSPHHGLSMGMGLPVPPVTLPSTMMPSNATGHPGMGHCLVPSSSFPHSPDRQLLSQRGPRKEIKRRTKTGCLTCRKRRIKCDEARPTCKNCHKSRRDCAGYEPVFKAGVQLSPVEPSGYSSSSASASTSPNDRARGFNVAFGSQPPLRPSTLAPTGTEASPAIAQLQAPLDPSSLSPLDRWQSTQHVGSPLDIPIPNPYIRAEAGAGAYETLDPGHYGPMRAESAAASTYRNLPSIHDGSTTTWDYSSQQRGGVSLRLA
jgi:hypothetical protein